MKRNFTGLLLITIMHLATLDSQAVVVIDAWGLLMPDCSLSIVYG